MQIYGENYLAVRQRTRSVDSIPSEGLANKARPIRKQNQMKTNARNKAGPHSLEAMLQAAKLSREQDLCNKFCYPIHNEDTNLKRKAMPMKTLFSMFPVGLPSLTFRQS